MKTLPLSGTVNISVQVQGHDVELEDVAFTGMYLEEPPTGPTYGCGGTPGDVQCDVTLDDVDKVIKDASDWLSWELETQVVLDSSIEDAVTEKIIEKVLEDPENYSASSYD